MTTEQIAAVVVAVMLCLGNLAAWLEMASFVAKGRHQKV